MKGVELKLKHVEDFYLKPFDENNPYKDDLIAYLRSIGWYKLTRERHFGITIRHIAQTLWNKRTYNEIICKILDKYFSNWQDDYRTIFMQIFMRALNHSHKQPRDGSLPILQVFDFDNTLTRFPHATDIQDPLSIQRLLLKGIPMFKNRSPNEYPSNLRIDRIIVSASGDEDGIKKWLEKRGLTEIFKEIYALGGDKNKIHFFYKIRTQWKYDFILYYDDKLEFALTGLFFLFIPYWITGAKSMPRIKKIDTDGIIPLDYYLTEQ